MEYNGIKLKKNKYNVLVVDDSEFIKKQLEQLLISEGFNVIDTASDGKECISKYKQKKAEIDFITLDITMPNMDGLTALKHIIEYDKNAIIIMISGIGSASTVKASLMAGAKNYIVKPLNKEKIKERIIKTLFLIEKEI